MQTAFVGHPDCSRHDTGWKHPEHQGRLPALVRAVYRDMLMLHEHLLGVEAQPATEADLLRVHTLRHLHAIREAVARANAAGQPVPFGGDLVVSAASWDAARAAAGTAISGVDAVLAGRADNAFCAARPPGNAARAGRADHFSLINNVAVAARHLIEHHGIGRVLIVEWGARYGDGTASIFARDPAIRFVSVHQQQPVSGRKSSESVYAVALPPGVGGGLYGSAFEAVLSEALNGFTPDFILLSAGFDALTADPTGDLALEPADYHSLTVHLRERAETLCDGHLVSVLEGGYAPQALGTAVVQHLRALAGLPFAG